MKKIHIITCSFYPVAGGTDVSILNTFSALAERGWEVVVHTTTDMPPKKDVLPRSETVRGIQIYRYPRKSFAFSPFSLKINYSQPVIISLQDFLTFPGLFICFYTCLLKLLRLKKYTLEFTSHGMFNTDPKIYPGLERKVKWAIDHSLGVLMINLSVDKIRTVSKYERDGLLRAGINKDLITVITNGLEDEAFQDIERLASHEIKKRVQELGRYILQVAKIDRVKNQAIAIKALAYLPEEIKLVLLGPDSDLSYKKELVDLVQKLNLQNRVIFFGVLKGIDKYYLIRNAKVMVHMSRMEAFCGVIFEAMSQGVACVVSEKGSMEELIQNGVNGFCVDPDNEQEVAAKISWLIDDSNIIDVEAMRDYDLNLTKGKSWRTMSNQVQTWLQA